MIGLGTIGAGWIAEAAVYDIRKQAGYNPADVTAALNACASQIAASNAPGAILIPGNYNFTGLVDFTACTEGVALISSQRASSISTMGASLTFTGTGNPVRAIDARGLNSWGCVGVGLFWTDPAFTGIMCCLDGTVSVNGKFSRFQHMTCRGVGTADAAIGISLNQTYGIDFDHCVLYGTNIVRGKATQSDFANRINFGPGCYIRGRAGAPIRNPDMAWSFVGVTFEPIGSSVAGALVHDTGVFHRGMGFFGCYFADDSNTTAGAWITAASQSQPIWIGGGNILSALAAGTSIVKVDANGHGPIMINGNATSMVSGGYLIDYGATTGHMPCNTEGNGYSTYPTTPVNGTVPGGSIVRTPNAGLTDYADAATARLHWGDVAGRYIDTFRVLADTGDRLRFRADGLLAWGNGAGTYDVTVSRTSAGQLGVTGGSVVEPLRTITASVSMGQSDRTVICNSASAITYTLIAAGSNSIGKTIVVKNIGAGAVTISAAAIDGGTTVVLSQWQSTRLITDGASWYTV